MLQKIRNIEDVKAEVMRYFDTLHALPAPRRPLLAKNYLWQMIKSGETWEDAEADSAKFDPTPVDIADCWYMDVNFMPLLTMFEYKLLSYRFREKPLPWKVIEYRTHFTRQWLKVYMDKALNKLFVQMKS